MPDPADTGSNIDERRLALEERRLSLECRLRRRELDIQSKRFRLDASFSSRHLGTLVTSAISLLALVVGGAQWYRGVTDLELQGNAATEERVLQRNAAQQELAQEISRYVAESGSLDALISDERDVVVPARNRMIASTAGFSSELFEDTFNTYAGLAGDDTRYLWTLPETPQQLLVDHVETGEVINPSHPEWEGDSGARYRAYYYPDNRMLYRLESHSDSQEWRWYTKEERSGLFVSLCRAPEVAPAGEASCRVIVRVSDVDYDYLAYGYNTGTHRYKFTLAQGTPDDLTP